MYKILMNVQDDTACALYRAIHPVNHCREALLAEGIQLDASTTLSLDDLYDCYIFHRVLNPEFYPVLYDLKYNHKKKIVWDLDDNLFCIPEWSPANELITVGRKRCLLATLNLADHITLTTYPFLNQFSEVPEWADKLSILPNLVDLEDWNFRKRSHRDEMPIRVLWAGSMTHQKDIDLVGEAVQEIINEYPNIQFIFMGGIPSNLLTNKDNIKNRFSCVSIGTCPLLSYPLTLSLLEPDIALLPLVDCEFNQAKSNIKYLEMTLAGAACIASNVGPYRDTIKFDLSSTWGENTFDGIVTEDFYKDILFLCSAYNTKKKMNENALEKVKNLYSWQSTARESWLNFFRMLAQ